MIKRSTGVPGLDKRSGGGLNESSILLLLASPGSGKTILAERFAIDGLNKNEKVIYIATGEGYTQLEKELKSGGLKDTKNLFFVDCFSWRTPGANPPHSENVIVASSITDLNELTQKILMTIKKIGHFDRLVLDSVSDLLLYSEPQTVFKFLQRLKSEVVASKASAYMVLEFGLHEDKVNTTVNYVCDGMIEMRTVGERQLRIARIKGEMHPLDWVHYEITKNISIKLLDTKTVFKGETK